MNITSTNPRLSSRRQAHQFLRQTFGDHDGDLVTEYINEFEHVEGLACWQAFKTVGDLAADFRLYKENRTPT